MYLDTANAPGRSFAQAAVESVPGEGSCRTRAAPSFVIHARQLGQRHVVGFNIFEAHRAGVAGNVIGASQNQNNLGMQIDHILLHPTLAKALLSANVDTSVRGWEKSSDHAPVWIELNAASARNGKLAVLAGQARTRRRTRRE